MSLEKEWPHYRHCSGDNWHHHHSLKKQRFPETPCRPGAGLGTQHTAKNKTDNFLHHLRVHILEFYLFIANYVPGIVLRTSHILLHLPPQPCTVFPILQRQKLRLGNIHCYAQGHLSDKGPIGMEQGLHTSLQPWRDTSSCLHCYTLLHHCICLTH